MTDETIVASEEKVYILFSNPKTAESFESLIEVDQWVEVPPRGENCNCKAYRGMISDIIPCAAKRYVEFGGNLIKAKEASPETV